MKARILLIIYDNGSLVPFPPQGIMYLTAALQKAGHQVSIWSQDIHHLPEEHLTAMLNMNDYDVVGLGFIAGYWQYQKAQKIAAAVNASRRRHRFKFILGGHGPAAAPDFFRYKLGADCVFIGESINTLPSYIEGKVENMRVTNKNKVECLKLMDPDDFPRPAFEMFPIEIYRLIRWPTSTNEDFCFPILSGSGCKWKCTFCYRMDKGFRGRSAESCIDEMWYLWKFYRINHFQFSDELFMSSERRAAEFSQALLGSLKIRHIHNFKWDCNGRLNHASPEVLDIMRKAGCEYINYGIESLEPAALKAMNKGLTIDMINDGVENTVKAGMSPGINFMWGNIGDTAASLNAAVEFIIKWNPGHELRTIRPVTPYPGSPLFDEAIKRGLVKDAEDFYENKHINSDLLSCNFSEYSNQEFHNLLYKANLRLMHHHYQARRLQQNRESFDAYNGMNDGFRGFRDV